MAGDLATLAAGTEVVPFTAQTRMSGVDLARRDRGSPAVTILVADDAPQILRALRITPAPDGDGVRSRPDV